jgi:ribosomal protein S18 acetylase RimI-like enzyme
MMTIRYRLAQDADLESLFAMIKAVSAEGQGLIRYNDEITPDYVIGLLRYNGPKGLLMVAEDRGDILGFIGAKIPDIERLRHTLSDITLAVSPKAQGCGIGRGLFSRFIAAALATFPELRRLELYCRADNGRAVALYQSLGFVIEGRLKGRLTDRDGATADDVIMGLTVSSEP